MGRLVEGRWLNEWYDTSRTGGRFERQASPFLNWVTPDGAPGPTGSGGFKAESGRYHLYISYACPWAHRTLITRNLKGLQDHIGLSIVYPTWQKTKPDKDDHVGWVFRSEDDSPLSSSTGFGSFPPKDCIP